MSSPWNIFAFYFFVTVCNRNRIVTENAVSFWKKISMHAEDLKNTIQNKDISSWNAYISVSAIHKIVLKS